MVPCPAKRASGVRAFTLVELLVVISIIALLLAILLPSLQRARQQSRAVVCMAHCRQAGTAMVYYVNEQDTYLPHQIRMQEFDPDLPQDIRLRWFDLVAISVADADVSRTPDMDPEEWEAFKRGNSFYDFMNCPATPHWDVGRNSAIGYNYKYLGSFRDNRHPDNPYAPKERFPVKNLRNPGATIAFADCDGTGWTLEWGPEKPAGDHDPHRLGNHGYILDPTYVPIWSDETYSGGELEPYAWKNWRTYLSDRHLGKSTAIFADGHGQSVRPEDAYRDNAMWNGLGLDPGLRPDGSQDTNHPLYRADPHVSYKLAASSGQEWRYPECAGRR